MQGYGVFTVVTVSGEQVPWVAPWTPFTKELPVLPYGF